jgi:hypothetical protein
MANPDNVMFYVIEVNIGPHTTWVHTTRGPPSPVFYTLDDTVGDIIDNSEFRLQNVVNTGISWAELADYARFMDYITTTPLDRALEVTVDSHPVDTNEQAPGNDL